MVAASSEQTKRSRDEFVKLRKTEAQILRLAGADNIGKSRRGKDSQKLEHSRAVVRALEKGIAATKEAHRYRLGLRAIGKRIHKAVGQKALVGQNDQSTSLFDDIILAIYEGMEPLGIRLDTKDTAINMLAAGLKWAVVELRDRDDEREAFIQEMETVMAKNLEDAATKESSKTYV